MRVAWWLSFGVWLTIGVLAPMRTAHADAETPPGAQVQTPCEGAEVGVDYCAVCHAGTAQLYDVVTDLWRIDDLVIDFDAYRKSSHKKLNCLDCHAFTWPFFPHPDHAAMPARSCLGCHRNQERFRPYRFQEIAKEMNASVHQVKRVEDFDCFSCHNPHMFKLPDPKAATQLTISQSNETCIHCHQTGEFDFVPTRPKERPLDASHSWLPKPKLHWKHVRCIECHTPNRQNLSHRILSATEAERNCEACHSQNSILLTKLYEHRVSENKRRFGFVNSIAFNDAYIIGMTRNVVLDGIFLALFGLVVFGVSIHAALRLLAALRRKKNVH
jgi:hypothetical protein